MSERLQRLRERLAEAGLNGFVVGAPVEDTFHSHAANRRYLSDFTGSMGWLLITADAAFIAVDFRYFEQAERESPGFTLFRTSGGMESWLGTLVGEAGLTGKRIGFEPAGATVSAFQAMKRALAKIPSEERPGETLINFETIDGQCALIFKDDGVVTLGHLGIRHPAFLRSTRSTRSPANWPASEVPKLAFRPLLSKPKEI